VDEKVEIGWSTDDDGFLVKTTKSFRRILGYHGAELKDRSAISVLRPDGTADDPELSAITAAALRLKAGETQLEHIPSTWLPTKSGWPIEITEIRMRRNVFRPRWDVVATATMVHRPLDDLKAEVEELSLRVASLRNGAVHPPSAARAHRRPRSDKGQRKVAAPIFEQILDAALQAGHPTVVDLARKCEVSWNVIAGYLKPYASDAETPAQTLARLGRERYPSSYLL